MSQLDFYTTAEEAAEFIMAYEKVRDTVGGMHSLSAYSSADHTNFTICAAATDSRVLMELSAALYTELPARVIVLEDEEDLDGEGEPYTENSAVNFSDEAPEPFSSIGTGVDEDEPSDVEDDEEEDGDLEENTPVAPKPGPRPKLIRQNGDRLPSSVTIEG
jgi:hypothetical protein